MANEEQLAILKRGIQVWNEWRKSNGNIKIDLSGADLSDMDLTGIDLRDARLTRVDFRNSNLQNARLSLANLSRASFADTTFGATDLSLAIDLEKTNHHGPSTIGLDTIHKSKGDIPESFLRGCGLSDADIEFAKLSNPDFSNEEVNKILYKVYELRASQAVQVSPLFISYSHADGLFVDKLEDHLNKKGIRFWRDVHDMKSGRIESQIDRAIRQNPTVLLILLEHSLQSDWVEHEVRSARELEKDLSHDVLCPIALDDNWKSSPWPKRVMEQVMEYNILDFSIWKDDGKFGNTFNENPRRKRTGYLSDKAKHSAFFWLRRRAAGY